MRKNFTMMLVSCLASLALFGCTPSTQPVANPPPNAPPLDGARYTSSNWPEYLADSGGLRVWVERDTTAYLSRLLADPQAGVWAGQDGELFHFTVTSNRGYVRTTVGRPDPTAVWVGDLVWLNSNKLAGRMVTSHLVRKTKDGAATQIALARSPQGSSMEWLDVWQGAVHLQDRRGCWYTLSPDAATYIPLAEMPSAVRDDSSRVDDPARARLEQDTGGKIWGWPVQLPDGTLYALARQEQLFTYDLNQKTFSLLGSATPEQEGPVPIGSLDGMLLAQRRSSLLVLDDRGEEIGEYAVPADRCPFLGDAGWVYSLPLRAFNIRTGELREWTRQLDQQPFLGGFDVTALVDVDGKGQQFIGATGFFGFVFTFDALTGEIKSLGRPIPNLGQESGEEVAPITSLAKGSDGFIYGVVGTGARGSNECHVFKLSKTGAVLSWVRLDEAISHLVVGADGRLYGAGMIKVVVLEGGQ